MSTGALLLVFIVLCTLVNILTGGAEEDERGKVRVRVDYPGGGYALQEYDRYGNRLENHMYDKYGNRRH